MDLGVASKAVTNEKGVEAVEVEIQDEMDMIDTNYERALENLLIKPEMIQQVKCVYQ